MKGSQLGRKVLAMLVALLASAAMSFSTIGLVSASSEDARGVAGDIDAGEGETSSSVEVPPWCAWYLNGAADSIDLEPPADTKYIGDALVVTAESPGMYAYIGSASEQVEVMEEDNCSWFGAAPWQAEFTVSIDGTDFVATTFGGARDEAMDFAVDNLNPISIDPTLVGCDLSFAEGPASQLPSGTDMSAVVWTNTTGGTNDFCTFSFDYSVTIPADMVPSYGGTTYLWAGPNITHSITVTDPDA